MADCQNWQDIDPENSGNTSESIYTSMEVVDGRQKVRFPGTPLQSCLPTLHSFCYEQMSHGFILSNDITKLTF